MIRKIFFFILAVVISFAAASYRWGDSAHSIGMIRPGGTAKHPSTFESGYGTYTLIATGTVLPPYRGDARIVLEGETLPDYKIYASSPVIDLGIRNFPKFRDGIFYGLKPGDRIALWVVMDPPVVDPVCGMACGKDSIKEHLGGKEYRFCSESCRENFKKDPVFRAKQDFKGKYTVALVDTKTGTRVLTVPVVFKGKGEKTDAGEQPHH